MSARTVAPEQTVADLRAGAVWVRKGWCTGVMCNPATGAVCQIGGIAAGIFGQLPLVGIADPVFTDSLLTAAQYNRWAAAEDAVTDYLARSDMLDAAHVPPVVGATDWNDMVCQSGEQAAQILEATAADLERGQPC